MSSGQRVRIDADLVRRRTAEHMTRAINEIPAFHLSREIDATRTVQTAERVGATITAVMLKHVAAWLIDVPELNSEFSDGQLRPRSTVDLGVALSYAQNVLVVPTLRDCRNWSEAQFADALKGLRRKADDNQFTVADFASAGFTVSNLGSLKVDSLRRSFGRPRSPSCRSVRCERVRESSMVRLSHLQDLRVHARRRSPSDRQHPPEPAGARRPRPTIGDAAMNETLLGSCGFAYSELGMPRS